MTRTRYRVCEARESFMWQCQPSMTGSSAYTLYNGYQDLFLFMQALCVVYKIVCCLYVLVALHSSVVL